MRVFFNEFSRLFSGDRPEALPTLDIQYADYALWQQSRLEEGLYAKQTDYWAKQLKDVLSGFSLPTDYPRPKVQTYNGARVTQRIPATLSTEARKLAANRGVTLFALMLTVFKTLLARYSQREDIVVGTVVANRDYVEIENLIGFLVNPVVLRSNANPTMGFADLLTQVSQTTQEAYANHALPFERLVDQLQPERDTSRSPLFQIAFDLRDPDIVRCELDDICFGIMEPDLGSAQYDLHLTLEQDGEELLAFWEFNTDLFSRATIERMSENYQQLLASVLAQPEQSISLLPLLSSSETTLLQSWSECPAPFPDKLCMHQLFEQHVLTQPEADALMFEDQRLSYSELNRRANQLAHYLREQGAGPDRIIAICLDRSVEMVVSVLAVLKSGAAYLALDPAYPSDRLAFMLEDSGVSLLLSNTTLTARLPRHSAKVIEVDSNGDILSGHPESNPDSVVNPNHLAYVIYTSGSTGKPKGVLVEHHGWCNVAEAQIKTFGLVSGMRVLQFASLSFDASAFEFSMAWGSGGALCLGTQDQLLPGPNLAKMLSNSAVEVVTLPPTALGALPDSELPDLKVITVAGEACPRELVRRWSKPGKRFFNLYGPTETTIWASYAECFSNISSLPPIGKPVSNMELYVVDQQMQKLPIGMPGELCIGGEGVTRGYLNRPQLNGERFIVDPFRQIPNKRLYRSGDLVRFQSDGNLEFLGRLDHQVKIRGHRVELGEIESQLRCFPGVAEAVVVAHIAKDGERQLLAYASPAGQVLLSHNLLREHLRKTLPMYMVPAQIMVLEEIPLSPNGKVDRKALPSPESQSAQSVEIAKTAQSEMEQVVSDVWQRILQIDTIDIHQNFFDLGGHSMKMAQVQTALSQELRHEIPLVDLFQYPTISALAAHFGGGSGEKVAVEEKQDKQRGGNREGRNRMAQLAALSKASRKRR
jgi:amino acid adenylation domain-containing protein